MKTSGSNQWTKVNSEPEGIENLISKFPHLLLLHIFFIEPKKGANENYTALFFYVFLF